MPLGKSFREVTLSARAPIPCFANLVDAGHPKPIVGHGPDHPSHKGAMPILVLHVPVLPAIREIRAIDVIDDPCMCAFSTSPGRITDLNPDTCALHISAQHLAGVSWLLLPGATQAVMYCNALEESAMNASTSAFQASTYASGRVTLP